MVIGIPNDHHSGQCLKWNCLGKYLKKKFFSEITALLTLSLDIIGRLGNLFLIFLFLNPANVTGA